MKIKLVELLNQTSSVGVVTRYEDVLEMRRSPFRDEVNILEVRLDKWSFHLMDQMTQDLIALHKPLIITPRDFREGGKKKDWRISDRISLYRMYMRHAAPAFVDVEELTLRELAEVVAEAKKLGIGVIISYHNLVEMPSFADLLLRADACHRAGGDVFKIAVRVKTLGDLVELEDAVSEIGRRYTFKVSAMATGEEFGKISRFLDARVGGPFIYGYLTEAAVPGQPNAFEIKKTLALLQ